MQKAQLAIKVELDKKVIQGQVIKVRQVIQDKVHKVLKCISTFA